MTRDAPLFWEHEGNSAVRVGDFKLVREHGGTWDLYDMHEDRTELRDIAGRHGGVETDLKDRSSVNRSVDRTSHLVADALDRLDRHH